MVRRGTLGIAGTPAGAYVCWSSTGVVPAAFVIFGRRVAVG
ncbi:MAG: hypothetical protein AVDCRST_MAG70-142 [uncultured Thermomicrobiales bacterium]|uniref:Uncharacterized protein n=1 Tax=uncultured Thermomicrobiales bacterium TaxID=1645740 RepID=A0A6J4U659_9BACT|nr:MAG: hypothetical protein AVDCRST_MAG70-142 [uncultured Thermomicrobiales bacterium]